jgi:hypothetical protein
LPPEALVSYGATPQIHRLQQEMESLWLSELALLLQT